MQRIKTYKHWSILSDREKDVEYNSWNVYEGEGQNILEEVIKHFKEKYKHHKDILEIDKGLYHGGLLIISATIRKSKKPRLPKSFEGFPVMKFYK